MLWLKRYCSVLTFDILFLLRCNTTVVHFGRKTAQPGNEKILVMVFESQTDPTSFEGPSGLH